MWEYIIVYIVTMTLTPASWRWPHWRLTRGRGWSRRERGSSRGRPGGSPASCCWSSTASGWRRSSVGRGWGWARWRRGPGDPGCPCAGSWRCWGRGPPLAQPRRPGRGCWSGERLAGTGRGHLSAPRSIGCPGAWSGSPQLSSREIDYDKKKTQMKTMKCFLTHHYYHHHCQEFPRLESDFQVLERTGAGLLEDSGSGRGQSSGRSVWSNADCCGETPCKHNIC